VWVAPFPVPGDYRTNLTTGVTAKAENDKRLLLP